LYDLPAKDRAARRGYAPLLLAVAPLLLCLVLTWYGAQRSARDEAALAAIFIRNQVGFILEQSRGAAQRLAPATAGSCAELMPGLMREAAVAPYLRTLNVLEHDRLYCSSALGLQEVPLKDFAGAPEHAPPGPWLRLVDGTPMVPDRPALLVGEPGRGGRSVLAVVDDRYLLDLLRAVTPLDVFRQVELRFGDGPAIYEVSADAAGASGPLLAHLRVDLREGPLDLRIYGLQAHLYRTWGALLLRFVPLAAVVAGFLAWLWFRLQRERHSLRERLLKGIRAGEFHVEYQPLYGVQTGRCEGAEALLRWDRKDIGLVRPDVFITQAEAEHAIVPLTQHMLKLVAQDFPSLGTLPGFHLGINFAPEHLSGEELQADVRAFMATVAAYGPQVVLEITERSLMKNTAQAQANLEALRGRGVQVAIDDFGTGYCSLSYLEQFPFDILKIDRGFVLAIDPGGGEAVVLDAIIDLGHRLGARLVAEGVDVPSQFEYLRTRGVEQIQGYLFARPMPAAEFAQWYRGTGQKMAMQKDARPATAEEALPGAPAGAGEPRHG
jgi:EAL domain-containing protein (putative c-di-GMP-specific phosphodiesterase class I)